MKASAHFLKIYEALSETERSEFRKYVRKRYADYRSALDVLERWHRAKVGERQAVEYYERPIRGKLHEASRVPRKITDDFYDLKRWLLAFLRDQDSQSLNEPLVKMIALEGLLRRQLIEIYTPLADETYAQYEHRPIKSPKDGWLRWQLAHYDYHVKQFDNEAERLEKLQDSQHQLEAFYTLSQLKYLCEMLSVQKAAGGPMVQIAQAQRFIETCIVSNWHTVPVFSLYIQLIDLIVKESNETFVALKGSFQERKYQEQVAPEERLIILTYLSNYISGVARFENTSGIEQAMDLYEIGLAENLFTAMGYFSYEMYYNIVQVGCICRGEEWANNFNTYWSKYLPPTDKENMICLCRARIHYEAREYSDAIDILCNELDFKNVFYHLSARVLLLRCYYDQNRRDTRIKKACIALKRFTQRQEHLPFNWRISTLNFVQIMLTLCIPRAAKISACVIFRVKKEET